jgi:hypothetical protein
MSHLKRTTTLQSVEVLERSKSHEKKNASWLKLDTLSLGGKSGPSQFTNVKVSDCETIITY